MHAFAAEHLDELLEALAKISVGYVSCVEFYAEQELKLPVDEFLFHFVALEVDVERQIAELLSVARKIAKALTVAGYVIRAHGYDLDANGSVIEAVAHVEERMTREFGQYRVASRAFAAAFWTHQDEIKIERHVRHFNFSFPINQNFYLINNNIKKRKI